MAVIRVLPRKVVGQGNRVVQTLTNGTVIKFGCPNSPKTGGQNLIEAAAWRLNKHKAGILDAVMPVADFASDGSWLYMPEAKATSGWSRAEVRELTRRLDRLGMSTDDMHDGNLGYNAAGTLVMIDYGFDRQDFHRKQTRCNGCEWSRISQRKDIYHLPEGTCAMCYQPIADGERPREYRGHVYHARCW